MPSGALLTLPNAVSVSRLLLAPLVPLTSSVSARVVLVATAAATDLLDGWLARRRQQVTPLGAVLDPVADRGFVLTVVGTYVAESALSWSAAALLLARDVATTLGFALTRAVPRLRATPLRARAVGKLVTALQLVTLLAVLVAPSLVGGLLLVVGLASLVAIADYARAVDVTR